MKSGNSQLMMLIKQGFTYQEAAESLGLDPVAVEIAVTGETDDKDEKDTLEELAKNTLRDIMQYGESETAKALAAKFILEGKAKTVKVNATKLTEALRQMREAAALMEAKTITIG